MIYPIAEQLRLLFESFIDPETGEVNEGLPEEFMREKVAELQMEFDEKIQNLRNAYINLTAEAAALKEEKQRLAVRQQRAERSAERVKDYIAFLLQGEKFRSGTTRISYRKSDEVVVDEGFVEWAKMYMPGLLNFKEPEPRKADIKTAIKNGNVIEHAHIEEKQNIQVK